MLVVLTLLQVEYVTAIVKDMTLIRKGLGVCVPMPVPFICDASYNLPAVHRRNIKLSVSNKVTLTLLMCLRLLALILTLNQPDEEEVGTGQNNLTLLKKNKNKIKMDGK